MTDISNWEYYYNLEFVDGTNIIEKVRANLVYTPRVSPDKTTFCLDFNRDIEYHFETDVNRDWNDHELETRFEREIKFCTQAKHYGIPVLDIKEVDYGNRRIFIEWPGDDFSVQTFSKDRDIVLPDWKEQWLELFRKMQEAKIYKISLHPNSYTIRDGVLVPFNWFFSYGHYELSLNLGSLLLQISKQRQEKLAKVLNDMGYDLTSYYKLDIIQKIGLNSFRSNYPSELIDRALELV